MLLIMILEPKLAWTGWNWDCIGRTGVCCYPAALWPSPHCWRNSYKGGCSLYFAVACVCKYVWVGGGWPQVPVCHTSLKLIPGSNNENNNFPFSYFKPVIVFFPYWKNLRLPLLQPSVQIWSYSHLCPDFSTSSILLPLSLKNFGIIFSRLIFPVLFLSFDSSVFLPFFFNLHFNRFLGGRGGKL